MRLGLLRQMMSSRGKERTIEDVTENAKCDWKSCHGAVHD